jgi:iron complex outermembrane receptor protein/vitamin B12 transporter
MRRDTDSVYAEGRRAAGRWRLHAGLRYEHSEDEDDFLHPALGVQYQANDGSGRIGAALSSAAKLPSFYALAHPLVGNPDLDAERSRQVELYYATPAALPWKSRITVFRAHYRDLIDFDPGPPPRLVNRASIRSTGVELSASRRWHPRLLTYGQLTRMNLDQPAGAPPLRFRPKLQGHLGTELRLDDMWRAHADLSYLGRRADSSIPTGEVWLGGRSLLSLSLARQAETWEVFVALDNALDKESEEAIGTPLPGRRLRAGFRWTP